MRNRIEKNILSLCPIAPGWRIAVCAKDGEIYTPAVVALAVVNFTEGEETWQEIQPLLLDANSYFSLASDLWRWKDGECELEMLEPGDEISDYHRQEAKRHVAGIKAYTAREYERMVEILKSRPIVKAEDLIDEDCSHMSCAARSNLEKAGIVTVDRKGNGVFYSLTDSTSLGEPS